MWQDYALGAVSAGFLPSFWATMRDANARVPRKTSVPTSILSFALCAIFLTVPAPFAAGTNALIGSCWAFIAWRRAL